MPELAKVSNLIAMARENGMPVSVTSKIGKTYYNITSFEVTDSGWIKLTSSADGKDPEAIFIPIDQLADIVVATGNRPVGFHAV